MLLDKGTLQFQPGSRIKLTVILLFLISYSIPAQQFGLVQREHQNSSVKEISRTLNDPIPAGTYTIGTTGDFTSIDSAFNRLSMDGISGPVTFELIDELYTAPETEDGFLLNGPIPGTDENNRVTIHPAENQNVIIRGNGSTTFKIRNTSYLTIDGVTLTGNTSLEINALYNPQIAFNDAIEFDSDCDYNIIQNLTVQSNDHIGGGAIVFFANGGSGSFDYNIIQNNFIKGGCIGIFCYTLDNSGSTGNILRQNKIGSPVDSLIEYGVLLQHCTQSIIENNEIQNLKANSNIQDGSIDGIIVVWDQGDIIRNNVVHNIRADSGFVSLGIALSGSSSELSYNNIIYNNMIYDLRSLSHESSYGTSVGIYLESQINAQIYFNSVYLNGYMPSYNIKGSSALGLWGECTDIIAQNNILVNTRDDSPSCAAAIFDYTSDNLTSENNDLYYVQNQYNCLVNSGGNDYYNLEEWQTTGNDLNSISEMPNFIEPDLHIDVNESTRLESHAVPVAGIETDLDSDIRDNTLPDIGADEFEGFTPIQEWYQIAGPFAGMTYGRISVVDANIVWITGGDISGPPKVFRTVDGGLNWTEIPTGGLPYYFMCIVGKDSLTAFVGDAGSTNWGGDAKLFKTTDAGEHWIVIDSTGGTGGFFDDLQFSKSNPEFGIAVSDPPNGPGTDFLVEKTTDGGITWERTTVPGQSNSYGTYYASYVIDQDFYGFASLNLNGRIKSYTTSDGGANWYLGDQGVGYNGGGDIVFNDDKQHGIMLGVNLPYIMVTSDGGLTWTSLNTNMSIGGFATASWISGTDVVFICSNSSSTGNKIIRSDDNGLTWQEQVTPDLSVVEIDYVKSNNEIVAYAVTCEGMILKSYQSVIISDIENSDSPLPINFTLEQNYPNPFNPTTTIRYQSPENCIQTLRIYDILGNEVKTLVNEYRQAGTYEIKFNASSGSCRMASGVYFYRIVAGNYTAVKKMILLK